MNLNTRTAVGLLLIGFLAAGVLFVAVELISSPPDAPFPSWRPAASPAPVDPTPTALPAPRTLLTASQGAS